jgi:hypothetical protein
MLDLQTRIVASDAPIGSIHNNLVVATRWATERDRYYACSEQFKSIQRALVGYVQKVFDNDDDDENDNGGSSGVECDDALLHATDDTFFHCVPAMVAGILPGGAGVESFHIRDVSDEGFAGMMHIDETVLDVPFTGVTLQPALGRGFAGDAPHHESLVAVGLKLLTP